MGSNDIPWSFAVSFFVKNRNLTTVMLFSFIATVIQLAPAQTVSGSDSNFTIFSARLDGLVTEIHSNNPQLKAAGNRVDAAKASIRYQKSLDPPFVGVESYQTPVASFPDPLRNYQE